MPFGTRARVLCAATLLLGLTACGGGDDDISVDNGVGDTYALTTGNRLITFNRTSPGTARTAVPISGLAAGESLLGIDFRPANGALYGLTSTARLVTIDLVTGVATIGATLAPTAGDDNPYTALSGTDFGIDFNPVPDRLRVVSNDGQNLRINVDTGAVITDGTLNVSGTAATGVTAVAYTNNFAAACRTALYYINTTSNTLFTTSDPNAGTLTAVGSTVVPSASGVSAFEIITSDAGANTALAALTTASGPILTAVNLTTGAATPVGLIGAAAVAGEAIRGLAFPPQAGTPTQAAGELYGVTDANRLVTFNRGSPAKLCTSAAIAPLNTGENVVGIDFRPSTGALHALANASGTARLLTLDPATAAVTTGVALSQPLTGTDFGMDFNPTGPVALRIVSDTGQNLRVTDIAAGTTVVDGALNGAGTSGSAAAYTNSVAGAGTTTLYVIDATNDTLNTQNPPNNGTLVPVGPLGADVSSVSGFDIDGRDNIAFAAVDVAGGTGTTLHTINLATGAASASLGTVGGGARLRGLARNTPTTTVFALRGNDLVTLSLADPTAVTTVGTITGLGSETLVGIDVRPSTRVLYGVGNGGGLFAIDTTTAAATRVALSTAPDVAATGFGVDFNPAPATVPLRIVSNTAQNLRVSDIAAGTVVTDTSLTRAADTFSIVAGGYTNSVTPNPTATVLYGLDAAGDRLVAITPPNNGVVRVIGPVGFDFSAASSLEIVGPGTALASLTVGGVTSLYTVNLTTGAATSVGVIGTPDAIVGLAGPISATDPAANSTLFVVGYDAGAGAHNLLSFARNAPGTLLTDIGLTGLGAGELVVGADFRSLDGLLWVLTNNAGTGRLYTVNTTTGAATLVSTLSAAAAGCNAGAAAFAGLSGTSFAVDFNPLPATVPLRIISDTGQNLRVTAPATGTTCVDGSINQPAPTVFGAGYTNSFPTPAGTTATTALLVLDAATGSLLQQGALAPPGPNGGVLSNIGALSAGDTYTLVSGFDIGGGANGVSLAALQRIVAGTPEASSRLYRVNTLTGAATEVVPGALIGGAGSAPIGGLAIRIQ